MNPGYRFRTLISSRFFYLAAVFAATVAASAMVAGASSFSPRIVARSTTAAGQTDGDALRAEIRSRYEVVLATGTRQASDRPRQRAAAIVDFYAFRHYRPIWSMARLRELVAALDSLVDDGLRPDDYRRDLLAESASLRGTSAPTAADNLRATAAGDGGTSGASLELLATESLLQAIEDLSWGVVEPEPQDSSWRLPARHIEPQERLERLRQVVEAAQLDEALHSLRPAHPFYQQMQRGLRNLRHIEARGGWPLLPAGATLKPGLRDPAVAILRRRLQAVTARADGSEVGAGQAEAVGAEGRASVDAAQSGVRGEGLDPDADLYDADLFEAVIAYQRNQYLDADGAVGRATREALNVPVQARIDQVRVNLERARWLLHEVPGRFVLVDIAGFKISYFDGQERRWSSRVQVGKPYRSTPVFRSAINRITLNPTWTVPPTILTEDVLPTLRNDLDYLRRNDIRVFDRDWNEIDPRSIDWHRPPPLRLRQNAGPSSALGRAAIRFPNHFAIYLHDTPHQKLFDRSQRAFSSGCIRVERVMELVEILLADTPPWNAEQIRRQLESGETRNVTLATPVPVFIAYWTVDASATGEIGFKPDIYQRDADLLARLDARR